MPKAKPSDTKRVGCHLFTFYEKPCTITYRGVIRKETDKVFLMEDPRVLVKVLKEGKSWIAAPGEIDPKEVVATFEKTRDRYSEAVDDYAASLLAAEKVRFAAALAAVGHYIVSGETQTAAAG